MILGYNTNGVAFHDPIQAIDLLGDIGYRSLAITIDHQWLNPFSDNLQGEIERVKEALAKWSMRSTIETGARFLLDPKQKHQPTLLSIDEFGRRQRVDFLCRCIDIAAELKSDCVSLWSGMSDDFCDSQTALDRLAPALEKVANHAEERGLVLGFEPEPDMFVQTTGDFERLKRWVDSNVIKMTMDVGHLFCLGEVPITGYIHRFKDQIVNVHIEDMKAGQHDHLLFGEGDISFPPVIQAFCEIGYDGPLHVELSRHSHNAVEVARESFKFLNSIINAEKKQH